MARLYSDLQDSGGRRYYFGLASAPGGLQPVVGSVQIVGLAPSIFEQTTVFRNPATAILTLNGQQIASDVLLRPAAAALSLSQLIPGELRSLVITPALPTPDYAPLQENAPTILFINTISPSTAQLQIQSIPLNLTEGGNIGFLSPGVGQITLQTQALALTLIFFEVGAGAVSIVGQVPTLYTALLVEPEVGNLTVNGLGVETERPFTWIDVDRPPPMTWTTTTGISA